MRRKELEMDGEWKGERQRINRQTAKRKTKTK